MDRNKIIFISVMGIILCGAIWGFIALSSDGEAAPSESNVSLTAAPVREEKYDVDNRGVQPSPSTLSSTSRQMEVIEREQPQPVQVPDYFSDESSELERIQREILENDRKYEESRQAEKEAARRAAQENVAAAVRLQDSIMNQLNGGTEKGQSKKKSKSRKSSVEKDTVVSAPLPPDKPSRFSRVTTSQQAKTNSIRALVHSQQTVQVGSTLKMRITEDCMTDNGVLVKKNSFVFGQVTDIKNERVIVKITTVNVNGSILPFSKDVYSRDAQKGIYVPNTNKSESIKDMEAAAVSQTNTTVTLPVGVGGVATQLGVGAINGAAQGAKQATAKNIRRTKVTIKTNYELLFMEAGIDEEDFEPLP